MIVKHATLADTTHNTLRDLILTGHYAPGQRLQIEAVSRELGVSPTPLREAFLKLANEGLLEIKARKGTFVRMFDRTTVQESYEIREVLEGLAARLAAELCTPEDIEELRKINRAFKNAVDKKKVAAVLEADMHFHLRICALSNNAKLRDIITEYTFTNLFNNTGSSAVFIDNGQSAYEGHESIINALEAHKPRLAEKLMRTQIRAGITMVLSVFDQRE